MMIIYDGNDYDYDNNILMMIMILIHLIYTWFLYNTKKMGCI